MKKILTLIALLLVALAACATPDLEQITDLLPGSDAAAEAAPTEEAAPAEELVAAEEAVAEVNPCDTAVIPPPDEGLVTVHFINKSGGEMNLVWHDTGQTPTQLVAYEQVADGDSVDRATYATHEWLLQDEHGHMLANYVAKADPTQCVVVYPHFAYEGEDGPENWAELSGHYEDCGAGQAQSPIDLTAANLADLQNIAFAYGETAVNILNNGHTIQVDQIQGSQITIEGETYQLAQFHFHAPSEHAVNGQRFPIEMHLVHKNADGNLAVVGVFIAEGAENSAFTPVWEHLPEEETGIMTTGATVQLASLLPADQTVYRYGGSLTTPPCSEGVLWSVMSSPVEMSAEQIAAFTEIIAGNNRPLQPLNVRELELDETP